MAAPPQLQALLLMNSAKDAQPLREALENRGFRVVYEPIETEQDVFRALEQSQWDLIIIHTELSQIDAWNIPSLVREKLNRSAFTALISGDTKTGWELEFIQQGEMDSSLLKNKQPDPARLIDWLLARRELLLNQQQSVESLRTNEERLRMLSEMLADYAFEGVVDADGILNINWRTPSFERLVGLPAEDVSTLEGQLAIIHPDDHEIFLERHNRLMRGPVEDITEIRIITKTRGVQWLQIYTRSIWDEQKGRIVKQIGASKNITEHKLAEARLREGEQIFRLLTENASDLICLHDEDGHYTYVSSSSEALLGYKPAEMLGRDPYELIHPDDHEKVRTESHERAKKGEKISHLTYRIQHKSGEYRWFETATHPVERADKRRALATTSRDVTERVLYEQIQRRTIQRLASLRAIDRAILQANSPEEVASVAIAHLRLMLPCDRASVLTLLPKEDAFMVLANYTRDWAVYDVGSYIPIGDDEQLRAMNIGQPRIIDDLLTKTDLEQSEKVARNAGLRSWLSVPIKTDGIMVGVMNLFYHEPNAYDAEALELTQDICRQLAVAMRQTDLLEEINRHTAELEERVVQRTAELSEMKDRFETIFNSVSDSIVLVASDGRIEEVNQTFVKMFGYDNGESCTENVYGLFVEDDHHLLSEAMGQIGKMQDGPYIEASACCCDGSVFPASVGFSRSEREPAAGVICSIRDITERKQAEQALQESEHLFRSLAENSADIILIVDENATLHYINSAVMSELGYKPEEVSESTIDYVHPKDRELVLSTLRQAFASPDAAHMAEFRIRHRNGSWSTHEARIRHLFVEGMGRLLVSLRDVSKRKQVEVELKSALNHAKELNELKSRFVSMASHEFKTPMTTMLSSAGLIEIYLSRVTEDEQKTRHIREHLNKIRQGIHHLTHLLDDVLVIGKADAGRLEFNPTLVDLEEFCRTILEEFQQSFGSEHNLEMHINGKSRPAYLDRKLLQQILSNLLSNAIKYSPKGSIVSVTLTWQNENVLLQVSDEGIGIPERDQPRLFESFHRAANVGMIEGTGLGLAISKHAVEQHGGWINFQSKVDEGTTFNVMLPTSPHTGTAIGNR